MLHFSVTVCPHSKLDFLEVAPYAAPWTTISRLYFANHFACLELFYIDIYIL